MSKLYSDPLKSDKGIKQMSIPPYWGDVGVKKWSPFYFQALEVPFFGTQNWALLAKDLI